MGRTIIAAAIALLVSGCATGQASTRVVDAGQVASATLVDSNGAQVGTAQLIQTPANGVLIRLSASGLEPGEHGFHIHQTGECTTPDFSSAGGHFAPHGRGHGLLHSRGMHGGDMPNLLVPGSGAVQAERLAEHVSLVPGEPGYLLDADGAALVIHAAADDYRSQPSGDAGSRVACGVIR